MKVIEAGIQAARTFPIKENVRLFTSAVRRVAAAGRPSDKWASTGIVQYQLALKMLANHVGGIERWLPASSSAAEAARALQQRFQPTQMDLTPGPKEMLKQLSRAKVFFPRYGYGETDCQHGLCPPAPLPRGVKCPSCGHIPDIEVEGCGDMPVEVRGLAQALMDATVDGQALCKLNSINSGLVNFYERPSGTTHLGLHFDSPHHFEQPIYSIRLSGRARLAFCACHCGQGAYGTEGSKRADFPIHFEVPLLPGCLTEMSGFAARALKHAVLPDKEAGRTVSVVLRHIHESLLTPQWLANNKITRGI